jgi:tetratricopeptide (TPR) repeat protein
VGGGYSLADRLNDLRTEKELPIGYFRVAARLIARVAEALEHAHTSGVIHRDVKPSNILLTMEGDPKVSDFGLAKVEDALSLSRTGDFAGTPYYMSPEQAQSSRVEIDHRTDIYSLGVTLYEMLTLKRPFEGRTSHEVLKKIVTLEPSNPRKKNPRVPQDLAVICLKAMEKDPNQRYQRMEELADDLQRFLQGELILARPAGLTARLWKRVKRSPIVSATSGAALLALVILVLYVLWSFPQILKERNRAIEARNEATQQREAALAAKAEVEKEIEKVKAINEFMQSIFASPNPEKDGREIKVVEVLDKAEEKIVKTFSDQPDIEISLRNTIGNTYLDLGLYDSALTQLKAANEICRSVMGEEHPNTLRSMHNLAEVFSRQGKYSEAEALIRQVLEVARRVLGEEHPNTLISRKTLGTVFLEQGKSSEAEVLYNQLLETFRRVMGEEHRETLGILHNLAIVRWDQGKYAEAEKLNRQVLEVQQRALGEEHPDTLSSMNNLANALSRQGKYSEAEAFYRRILKIQRRNFGEEHPETLSSMHNLANALSSQGKHSEAISLYRQVVEGRRPALGEEHPDTLKSMYSLGLLLRRRGNTRAEAEALFFEVADKSPSVLGEEHSLTTVSLHNLARLYRYEGKLSKAEGYFRRLLDLRRRVDGEENKYTFGAMDTLAILSRQQGKLEEAEKMSHDVLELRRKIQGEDHRETLRSMNERARILAALDELDEAEDLLRNVMELRLRILGEEHHETVMTMNALADVLFKQNRYTEAKPLWEKCAEISRQKILSDDNVNLQYRIEAGNALTGLVRYDEAEEHLLAAYKVMLAKSNVLFAEALISLIQLYETWGKPSKAAQYRALLSPVENNESEKR